MAWPQQQPRPPRRGGAAAIGVVAAVVVLVAAFGITAFVTPGFLRPARSVSGLGQLVRVSPDSSAPPSSDQPPVSIPTQRAPEPHRTQALADPSDCSYPPDPETATGRPATPPADGPQPANGAVGVDLRTTAGDIGLTLDRALAPCTVASFLALAKQGFYTGTRCHRLGTTDLQMLQCGDPVGDGTGGPGYTVPDEFFPELNYGRGLVALANTGRPGSGGSQFFMTFGDNPIPPQYTVFGTVSDPGLAVLDKVARGGVDASAPGAYGDGTGPPKIPVEFTAVTVGG